MSNTRIEIAVGFFMILGFLAFGWLALNLGEVGWLSSGKRYTIYAEFDNISGISVGSEVQIAGVKVGSVTGLALSEEGYARAAFQIDKEIALPVDSTAAVKSRGLIGDKYVQIGIGGDEQLLAAGDLIVETMSAMDIESLISKFAFGKVDD